MATIRKARKRRAETWNFRLYVSDHSPRSMMAIANLKQMCESYLQCGYKVRVIDLRKNPGVATRDDILAVPTLKRIMPGPERTIIGSLSNAQAILKWLGTSPGGDAPPATEKLNVQPMGRA